MVGSLTQGERLCLVRNIAQVDWSCALNTDKKLGTPFLFRTPSSLLIKKLITFGTSVQKLSKRRRLKIVASSNAVFLRRTA